MSGEQLTPEQIWNSLSYEQRMGAAAHIFDKLANHHGTFRYLIYDNLGFKEDAYMVLCSDGMMVNNAISEYLDNHK